MEDYICLQLEESRIEFREEMRELQRHTKSQFGDIKSQFVEINGKLDEIIKLMPNWLRNNGIESPDLIVISSDQEIPNPVDDLLNNEPLDSVESGEKVVASQQSWIEHDVERAKNDVAIYEENCALNFVDVAACNERSATDLQKVENFTSATPIAGISASSTYSIGFEEAIDGRKNGTEGDACSQVCIAFDKLSKASQTALSNEHYAHCVFDEYPQPFIVEHSDRNGGSVDKRGVVLPIMDLLSVLNLTDETTMNGSMWLNELLMLIFDPGGSRPHRGCDLLGEHGDFHFATNVVYAPEYNYYAFDENSTSHSSVGVYTLGLTLGIPSTGFVRAAFHEFCEQKQAFIMLMSSQQVLLHDVDKCNAVVTVVLHLFSFSHPRDVITTSVHIFIGRKVALEEVEGAFTGESFYSVQNTDKIGTSASSIAVGNSKIYVIPAGLSIQRVPFDLAERALLPLVYTVLIEFTLLGRNNLGYQQRVTYKSSQLFDGFKPSQCRARRCSITEYLDVGLINKIGVPFVISVVHFDEMSCVTKYHSNVFYPGTKVYVAKWTAIEVHMNLQCIGAALAGILAHPVRCRPFDPGGNLLRQMEGDMCQYALIDYILVDKDVFKWVGKRILAVAMMTSIIYEQTYGKCGKPLQQQLFLLAFFTNQKLFWLYLAPQTTYEELGSVVTGPPIDALIQCILEKRSSAFSYCYDALGATSKLRCVFVKEHSLVFVAVYQLFLHLSYVSMVLQYVVSFNILEGKDFFEQVGDWIIPGHHIIELIANTYLQLLSSSVARTGIVLTHLRQCKNVHSFNYNGVVFIFDPGGSSCLIRTHIWRDNVSGLMMQPSNINLVHLHEWYWVGGNNESVKLVFMDIFLYSLKDFHTFMIDIFKDVAWSLSSSWSHVMGQEIWNALLAISREIFVMALYSFTNAFYAWWHCHNKTGKCMEPNFNIVSRPGCDMCIVDLLGSELVCCNCREAICGLKIMDKLIVVITCLAKEESEEIVDDDTHISWIQQFLRNCSKGRHPYKIVRFGASICYTCCTFGNGMGIAAKLFFGVFEFCHFTTLRTRRLSRGRICHEPGLNLSKFIIYILSVSAVSGCDVIQRHFYVITLFAFG